jgi:thioester reductase-like protein
MQAIPPRLPFRPVPHTEGRIHLVTGATGFVGAAVVLELLQQTRDGVVAMVRPGQDGAEARFRDALTAAAMAYGVGLDADVFERCSVVAGDVLDEGCGLADVHVGRVDQVWHSAASLRYEDRYREEIRATNVDGTDRVVALARRLGAPVFNHVSTAYVAGRRTGPIAEGEVPGDADDQSNNQYERAKVDAERLVTAARDLRVRVFRPSVVVGHRRTLAATTFTGFYGFVRQLVQFRGMVDRTQRGLLERTALRIRLEPDSHINLVPVDAVAAEAVRIALSDGSEGVYHLVNAEATPVERAIRAVFAVVGVREPEFVGPGERLPWLDAQFDERLDFYGSYIRGHKRFLRDRADATLGGERVAPIRYDAAAIEALGGWYLARLEAERRQLPVAR